mmetsp:Transcript_38174/g.99132  ORF Transcript_38174/g.99132 Transcript_38174/m.99132 type:complete len:401 (-) Transcript_38174:181-1383(-)
MARESLWARLRDSAARELQDIAFSAPQVAQKHLYRRLLLLPLLQAVSSVVATAAATRTRLYQAGMWTQMRLPVPVISVGNLTWGGNGKTPMVDLLARRCWEQHGLVPLVLSRGYHGADEARMLAHRLADTPAVIAAGPDRASLAAQMLSAHADIGAVLLDDGMQHLRVARDLEVCMVNCVSGFGNGHTLPRGPLREPPSSLRRADVVVLHHASSQPGGVASAAASALVAEHLGPGTPVLRSDMVPHALVRLRPVGMGRCSGGAGDPGTTSHGLAAIQQELRGAHLLCLAGIGCPQALEQQLAAMGAAAVAGTGLLADHQRCSEEVLDGACVHVAKLISEGSKGAVLITQKDYARQPDDFHSLAACVPVYVLESAMEVSEMEVLDEAIKRIAKQCARAPKE